jgi:hypothetical protein
MDILDDVLSTAKSGSEIEEVEEVSSCGVTAAAAADVVAASNEVISSSGVTADDITADDITMSEAKEVSISTEEFNKKVEDYVLRVKPHLVIMIPTYGFMCNVDFVICLMNTIHLMKRFNIQTVVEFCKNDSLIVRARNNLVAKAMARKETTHMFFVDSDIVWNAYDILKLLCADIEIIGGIYPKKKYNFEKMMLPDFPKCFLDKKKESILKDMDDLTYLKCKLVESNLNFISSSLEVKNNICEVRHIATGFMMMKREPIEELQKANPDSKYEDDCGFLKQEEQIQAYALFNTAVYEGHLMSEDWFFSDLCKKLNKKVYVDISINLCHVGVEYFEGSLLASLI